VSRDFYTFGQNLGQKLQAIALQGLSVFGPGARRCGLGGGLTAAIVSGLTRRV